MINYIKEYKLEIKKNMDATHLKLLFNGADDSKNIRKIWYIDEFIIIMIYTKSKPENFSV